MEKVNLRFSRLLLLHPAISSQKLPGLLVFTKMLMHILSNWATQCIGLLLKIEFLRMTRLKQQLLKISRRHYWNRWITAALANNVGSNKGRYDQEWPPTKSRRLTVLWLWTTDANGSGTVAINLPFRGGVFCKIGKTLIQSNWIKRKKKTYGLMEEVPLISGQIKS